VALEEVMEEEVAVVLTHARPLTLNQAQRQPRSLHPSLHSGFKSEDPEL
jgi:hypothetical protein